MKLRGLLVALVLLAALAGTLFYLERGKDKASGTSGAAGSKPDEKLFSVQAADIQQVTIEPAGGEKIKLERAGDKWKIVEPRAVAADDSAVSTMVGTLSGLTVSDTIEEKPAALKDYGLDPPKARVQFTTKSGGPQVLLLGEETPTGASVYAKAESQPRVVTLGSYVKSDLSKNLFDLRDKNALKFESATASRAWVQNKSGKFELIKSDDRWQLSAPWQARADQMAVNDLLRQAADAKMQAVEVEEASEKAAGQDGKFGLASPEILFKVQDASGTHELRISVEKSGKRYARSSDQPAIFTVASDLATQLGKAPADLRNKDVFDMDTWTASHLEATTPEGRVVLNKEGGNWKGSNPKKPPDASAVSDLLEKLKALRATEFPPPAPPAQYGLDQPVLRVQVVWGEKGLKETIIAGQEGKKAYAQREGEGAVYEVSVDALSAAREAVKKLIH